MSGYWQRRKQAAHERSIRMNKARWDAARKRRDALAAADPVKLTGRIVRRIIVVENETVAREVAIYDFDSDREARRKLRLVTGV